MQAQGSISRTFNLGTTSSSGESYSVVSSNKASLKPKFLGEKWKKPQHREKLEGKELYVTCEQLCFKITQKAVGKRLLSLSQVKKKQTHASFSMHFMQQNFGYKSVIIPAEDTDVMVLCLGMCHKIPSHLFQKCGTKNRTRFLDITTLSRTLGGSVGFIDWYACLYRL
ncbi:hypothetical protein GWK47_021498 [Chionoecetes opilio]|uniref:Uncharacterized protein n=1 Tax=Chionoecetes opilio TaxID=41210 RepID=A0A8J4XNN7_CHIOP|nr:hypothetical protein GWK47_021498 [Chionoecetes opilio]